ncbi:Hpt domain-containing protein [Desulfococcaceae bacterium HSG8]|nr:Hpt domain-containing protein [Desulfococcaceae bacterium HSG8]
MSRSSSDEIVQGYIEEVRTYVPSLTEGIESLRERPGQKEVLEETHRLVHTIKGASAMVGIYGLSHIACQMEDALEDVISGTLDFTDETSRIMSETVGHFRAYCSDFLEKGVNARDRLRETVISYRRLRSLPPEEDQAALEKLLEVVPEHEGRVTEEADQDPLSGIEEPDPELSIDTSPEDNESLMALLEEPDPGSEVEFDGFEEDFFQETEAEGEFDSFKEEGFFQETETDAPVSEPLPAEPFLSEPLPELLESFYEEAEEHLQDLGRSLNILESQIIKPVPISPSQKEVIRQIRRSVHTLKGASAVIGLTSISAFAHSAEDLLDWLYEKAGEIDPEIVSVLADSSGLLERLVAHPEDVQAAKAHELKVRYREIMASTGGKPGTGGISTQEPDTEAGKESPGPSCELFEGTEYPSPDMLLHQAKTLRVGMGRVDELVNLAGELIIASSAFDQKMDSFMNTIGELELSRDRLRDIAKEMEIGYEVKALEGLALGRTEGRGWKKGGNNGQQLSDNRQRLRRELSRTTTDNGFGENSVERQRTSFEDFDSLELDRYSELNLIIRTLNESVIDVGAINTHMANLYSDLDGHLNRQRVLLSELQDKLMRIRMTPMQTITNKLRRTVREIASKLGKKVRLVIEGADIELDRVIWEKITDPLMHILRNAVDHGAEPPELRQALGKPPVATIKLAASREGNQVVIRIADDGSGLNYEAIRTSARKAKISERADEMSQEELAGFIFHPGFSTRNKISEVSGRGVGMDVVKENIQDLKGTVRVASWKSKGTQFTIRIPLTLAVVRALIFTASGQTFAIALSEIKEIIRIEPKNISTEIEKVVRIGEEVLPLYYLAELLNIRKDDAESTGETVPQNTPPTTSSARPLVLIVEAGGKRGAMVIGRLIGQREIVIKSTGSHLRYVKGISGATIMGDGSVVPILNVEELFETETIAAESPVSMEKLMTETPLEIMVVDDSVSIRQVVSRLMEDQGWKVKTAKDGIDALERLREASPNMIVLDIEMPRMNGYEFLSAIRVQPAYQHIPVVMLTSRTTEKHRSKAISLGAKGFIVKPYNDEEFIDMVLELTGESA